MSSGFTNAEKNRLFEDLGAIKKEGEVHTKQIDTLFREMRQINTEGCPTGTNNARRLKALEAGPKRANLASAAASGGVIAGIIAGLAEVVRRMSQ